MNQNRIGTIEIHRPHGVEIWNIESGRFSLDKPAEKFRLNFWVESDVEYIKALEDTGCNPISFEITIPLTAKPDFGELWTYDYPNHQASNRDDEGYSDNFYYYEHDSLNNMKVQIRKIGNGIHEIKISGTRKDPIDYRYGNATYIILAHLPMKSDFNGLWDE